MKRRFRVLTLILVSVMPLFLKRRLYRWWFGYRIGKNVRIGIAFLDCATLSVEENSSISHGTVFWRCGKVSVGRHVRIGPLNLFRGGRLVCLEDYSEVVRLNVINAIPNHDCTNDPDSSFHLGYGSIITAEHRIDFTDRVSIGRCSILGGRNSSIWTHNRRLGHPVEIGDYCYVGSEIRCAPSARIPHRCIVGIGSVITHPLYESDSLIAGVPAKLRRRLSNEDYELIFAKTRTDLPDEEHPVIPLHAVGMENRR